MQRTLLRGRAAMKKFLPTLVLGAAILLVLLHSLAPTRRWQRGSAFSGSRMVVWRAVDHGGTTTPYACGSCVLDPLVYPDAYCSTTPSPTLNGTAVRPLLPELASLEPYDGSAQASFAEVLDALPRGRASTIGVLGDSFMQQTLDAIACDLRRGDAVRVLACRSHSLRTTPLTRPPPPLAPRASPALSMRAGDHRFF